MDCIFTNQPFTRYTVDKVWKKLRKGDAKMINISEIRPIVKEIMSYPFSTCKYNIMDYADIVFDTTQNPGLINDICYEEKFWIELASRVQLEIMHTNPGFIPEDALTIMVEKHNNYGAKPIITSGIEGIAIRITDKLFRFENMTLKELTSNEESLRDTLIDIYNYCILAILFIRKQIYK